MWFWRLNLEKDNNTKMKWSPRNMGKRIAIYGLFHIAICYLYWVSPGDIENTRAYPYFIFIIIFGPLGLGLEVYIRACREKE
jgi:hypothetical protein